MVVRGIYKQRSAAYKTVNARLFAEFPNSGAGLGPCRAGRAGRKSLIGFERADSERIG
jgi:hypothetical protein